VFENDWLVLKDSKFRWLNIDYSKFRGLKIVYSKFRQLNIDYFKFRGLNIDYSKFRGLNIDKLLVYNVFFKNLETKLFWNGCFSVISKLFFFKKLSYLLSASMKV